MDLFNLDPGLAIWTWVAFGLLCAILAKWVFPPLLRNLEQRESFLSRSVDQAVLLENRMKEWEQEKQKLLTEAQAQVQTMLQEAREQAEVVRQDLEEKAVREADAIVARGRVKTADEKRAAIEALRIEIAEFVVVCAGTIVGSTLTGEREREWARQLVKSL